MNSMLDILGASIIGGLLMLIALSASDRGAREIYNYNADAIIQRNISQLGKVLEFDLQKVGFGIPDSDNPLIVAQPGRLKFITQLNWDSEARLQIAGVNYLDTTADTIEYVVELDQNLALGDTSVSFYSLKRTIKIPPNYVEEGKIGVIANNELFNYYDQVGNPVGNPLLAKVVEFSLYSYSSTIILSPEIVASSFNNSSDIEYRRKELLRILRPAYIRQKSMTIKNLRR